MICAFSPGESKPLYVPVAVLLKVSVLSIPDLETCLQW